MHITSSRNDGRNRTTNQEKIRTLGEKETYKYLAVLEVDTIKKSGDERKMKKNIPG